VVDAGTGGGTDAGGGTDSGAVQSTKPFTGTYASKPVANSATAQHAAMGGPTQTPTLDCLGCHNGNGPVKFLAAGWVASAAGGTTGAADVEVGVNAGGTAYAAHTDADGYFWINPPAAGIPAGPYYPGVRNATTEMDMPTQPANTDCNSSACHGGQVIHIP
jgi:hypothetical protein